jgi:hypothetical protein
MKKVHEVNADAESDAFAREENGEGDTGKEQLKRQCAKPQNKLGPLLAEVDE